MKRRSSNGAVSGKAVETSSATTTNVSPARSRMAARVNTSQGRVVTAPNLRRCQCEAFVIFRRDVVALLLVRRVAEQRHEHAGLAGHVGAEVPRIARREKRERRNRVDVVDPRVLRVLL